MMRSGHVCFVVCQHVYEEEHKVLGRSRERTKAGWRCLSYRLVLIDITTDIGGQLEMEVLYLLGGNFVDRQDCAACYSGF